MQRHQFLQYATCSLLVVALLFSQCKKDKDEPKRKIGEAFQGGKIVYIFQQGDPGYDANKQHGIIVAASDQNSGANVAWTGSTSSFNALGTAIGTGKANSDSILKAYPTGTYAVNYCNDLSVDGFTDWHLPSKDELYKMYLAKDSIGNFSTDRYWSSTESGAGSAQAIVVRFSDGVFINQTKNLSVNRVRAVRYF